MIASKQKEGIETKRGARERVQIRKKATQKILLRDAVFRTKYGMKDDAY